MRAALAQSICSCSELLRGRSEHVGTDSRRFYHFGKISAEYRSAKKGEHEMNNGRGERTKGGMYLVDEKGNPGHNQVDEYQGWVNCECFLRNMKFFEQYFTVTVTFLRRISNALVEEVEVCSCLKRNGEGGTG